MLFSSPHWLLAPWAAGQRTPLVSQLGRGGWVTVGILEPLVLGRSRFNVPVLGTERDVSSRHLPVLTGRKTERLRSEEPEAAQEICGGAGTKPQVSPSLLFLPGWG